jgi:hypothetical protein
MPLPLLRRKHLSNTSARFKPLPLSTLLARLMARRRARRHPPQPPFDEHMDGLA